MSASGGACTSTRRPGHPAPSMARPPPTPCKMIDFAAQARHSAACWSKAGTRAGTATGSRPAGDFSFTKPYPDFDLPRIAAYAQQEGRAPDRPSRDRRPTSPITKARWRPGSTITERSASTRSRPAMCPTPAACRRAGPTGKIRFEWHEGQVMSRHHLKVVTEAAKRQIMINAARADQGHRPSAHLSQLGQPRGPAGHGI